MRKIVAGPTITLGGDVPMADFMNGSPKHVTRAAQGPRTAP